MMYLFPAPAERYVYSTRHDVDTRFSGAVCELTPNLISDFFM